MFKKAFTLLEMLVVIGIIAVLVSMVISSFSTAQKKARDSKRQSELKTAQQVMEQCYSVNSYQYPIISAGATAGSITATCPAPNTTITFTLSDPLNSAPYVYTITSSTTAAYELSADLETSAADFTVSNQQ